MLVLFHSSSSSYSNSSADLGFSCGRGGKQTEDENRFAGYEDEDKLNIPGLLTGFRRRRAGLTGVVRQTTILHGRDGRENWTSVKSQACREKWHDG